MTRSKLQSMIPAAIRCLLALCVFGLLIGPQMEAQRSSRELSGLEASRAQRVSKGKTGRVPFSISGAVSGLHPGSTGSLTLRVSNPHRFRIVIRALRVRARLSDTVGCGRKWIRPARKMNMSLLVPPRSHAYASYPVRMRIGAPQACEGARWPLRFRGRGSRG